MLLLMVMQGRGGGGSASGTSELCLVTLALLVTLSEAGVHERRLLEHLFKQYNRLERPVLNDSDALQVQFGLVLQQIIDVDEKNEIINTNLWLNLNWNDYNLSWNESEYGGIQQVRVPPSMIWTPDILLYNSADEDFDSTYPTNVVLNSAGDCNWIPPGLFRSTCKIDITWFPFDDQLCTLKFGSWTYDSRGIDLRLQGDAGDTSTFISNGEWELIGMPANRNVVSYECCPESYIDITFKIHIRRRTLYYGFNLILPCVLLSSMALLTFTLPPDAGEKISLGVTILLSLTVFLLLVAETMPPTSDALPLIGMYFACIMLMCSLSVVFTVLVLNCHYRKPDTHQMPPWVRKAICGWLARILFVRRPCAQNRKTRNKRPYQPTDSPEAPDGGVCGNTLSKSLLANVLDVDDNLLIANSVHTSSPTHPLHNSTYHALTEGGRPTQRQSGPGADACAPGGGGGGGAAYVAAMRGNVTDLRAGNTQLRANAGLMQRSSHIKPDQSSEEEPVIASRSSSLLVQILKELRFMTNGIKAEAKKEDECNDWKFAAMVIDRLCLVVFTCFTLISTIAILFSAPHIIV